MKDKLSIVAIVLVVVIFIVSITAVVLAQRNSFNSRSQALNEEIAIANQQISDIESAKDTNNYTPTEAVTFFLSAVKADATSEAKLYLADSVQNMDIKNTLKLGSDLTNLIIGESEQSYDDETATVAMNLQIDNDIVARTFLLEKVEGAWKINGIIAE